MQTRIVATVVIGLAIVATAHAAPPIELELATERGVQITAPREWLQLLAGIGIEHVRIRGANAGDEPRAENRGNEKQPNYHVLGIITMRDTVRLPGGTFTRGDRAKLKDYFDRLAADGAESLTAARGMFGLTGKELKLALTDLSQSVDFETRGQLPLAIVERLQPRLEAKVVLDGNAEMKLRSAAPAADELKELSAGTALAMLMRNSGLIMHPEKRRGEPVSYRITVAEGEPTAQSTLGKTDSTDATSWPIGWEPDKAPGAIAPSLLESLNAEIDGYSVEEALAAITPRLKLPVYVDHAALAAHNIELAKMQVKLARARMSYKRLLDRVLTQAHLGSSLRVDESGKPFLWVTR
jgi:hypothetical protein